MLKALFRSYWTAPILISILLIAYNLRLNLDHFGSFPQSIHAWAQADYYAMAQKFYLDTWNLFEPQSWILNKQFPTDWGRISNDALTTGNIAIHPYIVGMLMRLLGSDDPMIYRVYCFLWVVPFFAGFASILKTLNTERLVGVGMLLMVGLSPVFIYYSANFLNVIPCLAQTVVGIAFYFHFLKTRERKHWIWTVVILGITPLIRTTYVIPFIAVICTEGLRWLLKKMSFKDFAVQMAYASIFLILLGVWMFWNKKMVEKHDTIFLSGLMMVDNWNDVRFILDKAYETWEGHYFVARFIVIYIIFVVIGIITNRKQLVHFEMAFWGILSIGYVLFLFAMIRQFKDHDYYFLDTLIIPLMLFPVILWKDRQLFGRFPLLVFVLGLVGLKYYKKPATAYFEWRYNLEYMDPNRANYEAYKGLDTYLEKKGIERSEPIFVLSNMAPNICMIYIKHNGVYASNFIEKLYDQANHIKYFVIARSEISEHFEAVLKNLKPIDRHGEVLIMERNTEVPLDLEAFQSFK